MRRPNGALALKGASFPIRRVFPKGEQDKIGEKKPNSRNPLPA